MNLKQTNFHETAIEHIVHATREADKGDGPQAEHHISESKQHAQHHAKLLKMRGLHKDADMYLKSHESHCSRITALLNRRIQKTDEASSKCVKDHSGMEKGQQCNCGYMMKSEDLEKAFNTPFVPSSPARKEYNQTSSLKPMQMTKPGQDPRYSYKKIHELSPADQEKAQQSYPHLKTNMGRYLFPTDSKTGELAHARVAPYEGSSAPAASNYSELKPEHTKGTAVRINAPGHEQHGKLGIMQGKHPSYGNKVGVKMGPSEFHTIYVEPHHVQLSNPKNKIEKALVTLNTIQKAFMK